MKKILFLLILNLLIVESFAEAKSKSPVLRKINLDFTHYSTRHGLSQVTANSLVIDTHGFLWVGTSSGLNRFDGYDFKTFKVSIDDDYSLTHNHISALIEGDDHNMWVGTNGGGVNLFLSHSQRFLPLEIKTDKATKLFDNATVHGLALDNNNRLWVASDSGLHVFQVLSLTDSHVLVEKIQIENFKRFKVKPLYIDNNDIVWITDEQGQLYSIDSDKSELQLNLVAKSVSSYPVNVISEFNGTLLLGTEKGLVHFNRNKKTVENPEYNYLFNESFITSFLERDEKLWIATYNGVFIADPINNDFQQLKRDESIPSSLSHDQVISFAMDENGSVYIGTFVKGVNHLKPKANQFKKIKASNKNGLSSDVITSFLELDKERMLIGTYDGGLNLLSQSSNKFQTYLPNPANPKTIASPAISSIVRESKDLVWVGTVVGGLNLLNLTNNEFSHYLNNPNDPSSISNNNVLTILNDGDFLWVGTWGGGLNKFNKKTGTFKRYIHDPNDESSISGNSVWSIAKQGDNTLWVGTETSGLNKLDIGSETFQRFQHDSKDPNSISHNFVQSIVIGEQGTIWFAATNGLNHFDPVNSVNKIVGVVDGLKNETILGILEDDSQNLWLSTFNGISKYNKVTGEIKNYDENDGLHGNEFNSFSFFKTLSGEMFFGGTKGFTRFFPKNIQDDKSVPRVALTDLLVHNETVPIYSSEKETSENSSYSISAFINNLDKLVLTYDEKLVTFEFAALHFAEPMNNQYAYMLEGYDDDWIYTDAKNRRATYTSLPSGKYTLRVKASNGDGYWNEQGKSLAIEVLPPYWRSWWAYSLYVAIIIAIFGGILYRQNYQRLKEHAINVKLKEADRLKDEFLANTSHELRTPLNGIIGLAESLIDGVAGELPNSANKNLAMVVASGKRLSNLVNDILDFFKT